MECKLSADNAELEKKLKTEKERADGYKQEVRIKCEQERTWCDQLEKVLVDLGFNTQDPHLDAALRRALDELVDLRKQTGKDTDKYTVGRCHPTHCRRYVSSDWDFCPHCGRPMGEKVTTTTKEIFDKIELELPVLKDEEKKNLFAWSCRWEWAKRRLIQGGD